MKQIGKALTLAEKTHCEQHYDFETDYKCNCDKDGRGNRKEQPTETNKKN